MNPLTTAVVFLALCALAQPILHNIVGKKLVLLRAKLDAEENAKERGHTDWQNEKAHILRLEILEIEARQDLAEMTNDHVMAQEIVHAVEQMKARHVVKLPAVPQVRPMTPH